MLIVRTFFASSGPCRQKPMSMAISCRFSVAHTPICVWLLLLLPLLSSCKSKVETVTSPAQVRCGVQAQAEKLSFTFDGGTGTMRVTTNPSARGPHRARRRGSRSLHP